MQTLRTWAELADWLEHPTHPDIAALLQLRRDQLRPLSDLIDIGTFIVVQPGDTVGGIEAALGVAITNDGSPTWEWVLRHGAIFEAPIILSDDGFGYVLIVADTHGIDPALLALCRDHA
jgi:hypothetical protein